jgi:putative FmdB family regulatory protein
MGFSFSFNPNLLLNIIIFMPTYEYVCEKCGQQFDKIQPISAKPLEVCPEDMCAQKRWGKGKVKRSISAGGGLIFKGSGFYITDYRSEKYKEAAKKDSAASTSSSTGDTKKSGGEAKPASKTTESKPSKPAGDKKSQ